MSEHDQIPRPVTGLVAGKYDLVRLIGRGGMGSVWEGRHTSLGTRVAIKFIEPGYANSDEARSRFDNEARAAATIQSKYAIQIFDHGITETGHPYIVMEMLSGEPLEKRVARLGRIPLPETAHILQQVCRALQRAHDAGIVHRDLKPENIFLVRSPDDDEETAKVLDFGIAKIQTVPGQQGPSSSTKTGVVLGTPYYMSPEQARGLRTVDHRTDLWALGVIAYQCVAGALPFEGESVGDLIVKICTSPLPRPSQIHPDLPAAFDVWFERALDRDPALRFQSATQLADGLAATCGVSVRSGRTPGGAAYASTALAQPVSPTLDVPPGAVPTLSMRTPAGSSSHGTTAPPFVSPSPRAGTSAKGLVAASVGAALLGMTVGALAIARLTAGRGASATNPSPTATATASTTPASSEIAPLAVPASPPPSSCPPGMAALPGGTFAMGERKDTVTVGGFCMDLTEVTADAYAACVRGGQCTADHLTGSNSNYGVAARGKHPINYVDWGQSTTFCRAQGKRLPTEEEWEWAARGGAQGRTYPWGNEPADSQLCWSGISKRTGTCAVGSFPGGDAPGGIHDLAGNVWEWTSSNFDDTPAARVARGGCWYDDYGSSVRARLRSRSAPASRNGDLGFRCAR